MVKGEKMKREKQHVKWLRLMAVCVVSCQLAVLSAQTTVSQIDQIMDQPLTSKQQKIDSMISPKLQAWMHEQGLDSLDQEKIPKIVTMGVLASANMSSFLITTRVAKNNYTTTSSYMRVGAEIGGFMDFMVTRHFAVQARLVFTAEQNHFSIGDSTNHLWSFGMDIPVIFMYRMGNLQKGYWSFGGGPFAHFTFASNKGHYTNKEEVVDGSTVTPAQQPFYVALHDNHAGVMVHVNYEFPIGIQIGANYMISLSDIFGYYKNTKGTDLNNVAFYPQRVSLGIAYRWK